jgi:glutaredoxin 3
VTQPVITVYTTGWCPYCQRAKQLLMRKQLVYREINVEDDDKFREEMTARSGRRTVPQIFIGDRHIGGCDDLYALEGSGELDRLTEGAR